MYYVQFHNLSRFVIRMVLQQDSTRVVTRTVPYLIKLPTVNSVACPEVDFMNVFSWLRVNSRSFRSTLSYESNRMEFTDNLPKALVHCLVRRINF